MVGVVGGSDIDNHWRRQRLATIAVGQQWWATMVGQR